MSCKVFYRFVSIFFLLYLAELLAVGIWLLQTPVAFLDDSAIILITASSEEMCTNLALCMQAAVVLYALSSARKIQAQTRAASHFWKMLRIRDLGNNLLA